MTKKELLFELECLAKWLNAQSKRQADLAGGCVGVTRGVHEGKSDAFSLAYNTLSDLIEKAR